MFVIIIFSPYYSADVFSIDSKWSVCTSTVYLALWTWTGNFFSESSMFVQQLKCHVKFTFFGTLAVLVFSSSFCGRWIIREARQSNPPVPDFVCVWGRCCSALLLKFYNSRHLRLCWSSPLPTISGFFFVSVVVIGHGWNVSLLLVRILLHNAVTVGVGSCLSSLY
jgi:hypothetical protein